MTQILTIQIKILIIQKHNPNKKIIIKRFKTFIKIKQMINSIKTSQPIRLSKFIKNSISMIIKISNKKMKTIIILKMTKANIISIRVEMYK